jgi:hypothetical protein
MTLVISLVAAAMVTAISGTIMVEEDELLQFAVDSGELIIHRMMDVFQFSHICTLSGNRASLTVVLRLEPLPEVGTSDSPEQRDPSSTPVERTRSPQPHTILYPGYPFRLRCPLAPDAWNSWSIAITPNTALLFFGDTLLILKILLSHDKKFTIILSCSYALYLDLDTPFPIQTPRIRIDLVDSLVSIIQHLLLLL